MSKNTYLASNDRIRTEMLSRFERQDRKLNQILKGLEIMAQAVDDLVREVGENSSAVDSAINLINSLVEKLQGAIDSGDMKRVEAVVAELDKNSNRLAEAVAKNTPADPAPQPDPAPVDPSQPSG